MAMNLIRPVPRNASTAFLEVAALILAASAAAAAQIPVTKEPHHRVTFENAQLRILDVNVPPGAMSLEHRHDFDVVTISMNAGTETRVQTPGQAWTARPARPLGDASVAEYTGKPGSHRVENTGKVPYQLFAIENLRKSGWSTAKPASGLATKLATDARAFRVYDVRLPRETAQTSHTHAVPTIVVLVSGNVMSDGPDAEAKKHAPAPVGLKQLTQPGQWLLIPAGDTHHIVRLNTGEARVVEIEVR
jgi:quercetin dioxygenase-like cupin family protein